MNINLDLIQSIRFNITRYIQNVQKKPQVCWDCRKASGYWNSEILLAGSNLWYFRSLISLLLE